MKSMQEARMNFQAIYHFLFQTYAGIGVLFAATIVICLIACAIMEKRTRKRFKNHPAQPDDWDFPKSEE